MQVAKLRPALKYGFRVILLQSPALMSTLFKTIFRYKAKKKGFEASRMDKQRRTNHRACRSIKPGFDFKPKVV